MAKKTGPQKQVNCKEVKAEITKMTQSAQMKPQQIMQALTKAVEMCPNLKTWAQNIAKKLQSKSDATAQGGGGGRPENVSGRTSLDTPVYG
jgi:hypothetical protein